MLRNTLAGIENYDAENKSFTYKGHGVVFNGYYYYLTEPNGHTSTNQFNSWQRDPVTPEVVIDRAKSRIWELIRQVDQSKRWHHKNKVESRLEEVTVKGHWDSTDTTAHQYTYRGITIKVKYDTHSQNDCPWDDWDGGPSALASSSSQARWKTEYGKNKITIGTYSWKSWDDDVIHRYISLFLRGVSKEFSTRSDNYIAFWTGEEIDEHFDGDYHMAYAQLDGAIENFKDWAEGNVYGYVIEIPEDEDEGDTLDSCWGFYGDDGYILEEAMSQVDYYVDKMEKEKAEADEEVMSMMESELGFRPARQGIFA